MAFQDYADLALSVSAYTGRDDVSHLMAQFTSLAELKLNRRLRMREMMNETPIATDTAGEATLPTNYLEMRLVVNEQGRELQPTSLDALQQLYANRGGSPCLYAISGTLMKVRPVEAATYDIIYYKRIPELSIAGTNWLLSRAPDVYLYALAAEVSAWEGSPDKVAAANSLLDQSLAEMIVEDGRSKFANGVIKSSGPRP